MKKILKVILKMITQPITFLILYQPGEKFVKFINKNRYLISIFATLVTLTIVFFIYFFPYLWN